MMKLWKVCPPSFTPCNLHLTNSLRCVKSEPDKVRLEWEVADPDAGRPVGSYLSEQPLCHIKCFVFVVSQTSFSCGVSGSFS